MDKDRFYPKLLVALVFLAASLDRLWAVESRAPQETLQEISLDLPGPISELKGVKLHMVPGVSFGLAEVSDPHRLTLNLNDGSSLSLLARANTIRAADGKIFDIEVYPLMQPVSFKQLRQHIFQTFADLHIDDRDIRSQLAPISDDAGSPGLGGISPPIRAGMGMPVHGLGIGISINGNPQGWFYLIDFCAISPGLLRAYPPMAEPTAAPAGPSHEFYLRIPDQVENAKFIDLHTLHRGMNEVDLLEPQHLTLSLADGKTISLVARSLNVICFDQAVRGIYIRRPMIPGRFKDAKQDLLHILASLGVRSDEAKEAVQNWPDDAPGPNEAKDFPSPWQGGLRNLFHGLELSIQMRRDQEGGWYYLLVFADILESPLPAINSTQPTAAAVSSHQ